MKSFKLITLIFVLSFLCLSSCSDDDNSVDNYWVSLATAVDTDNGRYYLVLDNGDKLWIASPVGSLPKLQYPRVIANYTILSDSAQGYNYFVGLNAISSILTKNPIYVNPANQAQEDSIGNSPIDVVSCWNSGGYMNFSFQYNAGGMSSHMLNLVSDNPQLGLNQDTVKLQFRHNQMGDPQNYPVWGYVSFSLDDYNQSTKDTVIFQVQSLNYSGTTNTYILKYVPKQIYSVDVPINNNIENINGQNF